MSGKNKGTYVELGDELHGSLRAFCEALHGANKSRVIRNAVEAYIESELRSNDGLRERYEDFRQRKRRVSSAILKVVEPE